VMGDVKFSPQGEWVQPRVLTVQFQDIGSNDIEEFRSSEARLVVSPGKYSSGSLRTFGEAKGTSGR
jgi:branched-chain amino acid transport system substrate-binding protein